MKTGTNLKVCGRDPSCDIVVEHSTVSRFHAQVGMTDDGFVTIKDTGASNGSFLNRHDGWIRFRQVTLCIGDRIRFGDMEVPLAQLTGIFGSRSGARLEARHFPYRPGNKNAASTARRKDQGPSVRNPRRNPKTGKIEEERTGKTG